MSTSDRRAELLRQKARLVEYALMKLEAGDDWHAVQDASSDIRDIDARLSELARLETPAPVTDQTIVAQCGEEVGTGRCVDVAGHAGSHHDADGWTVGSRR